MDRARQNKFLIHCIGTTLLDPRFTSFLGCFNAVTNHLATLKSQIVAASLSK